MNEVSELLLPDDENTFTDLEAIVKEYEVEKPLHNPTTWRFDGISPIFSFSACRVT